MLKVLLWMEAPARPCFIPFILKAPNLCFDRCWQIRLGRKHINQDDMFTIIDMRGTLGMVANVGLCFIPPILDSVVVANLCGSQCRPTQTPVGNISIGVVLSSMLAWKSYLCSL